MHRPQSQRTERQIIGWREWVHLPSVGAVTKAKVDTGALTSAIHAFDLREYVERGCPMVEFQIHPRQRSADLSVIVRAEIIDRRNVRNSGGETERRIVVPLELRVGDITWTAEVTLTRRDQMGFRMLLGRRSLRNRFLVDPGRSFVTGRVSSRTKKRGRRNSH